MDHHQILGVAKTASKASRDQSLQSSGLGWLGYWTSIKNMPDIGREFISTSAVEHCLHYWLTFLVKKFKQDSKCISLSMWCFPRQLSFAFPSVGVGPAQADIKRACLGAVYCANMWGFMIHTANKLGNARALTAQRRHLHIIHRFLSVKTVRFRPRESSYVQFSRDPRWYMSMYIYIASHMSRVGLALLEQKCQKRCFRFHWIYLKTVISAEHTRGYGIHLTWSGEV